MKGGLGRCSGLGRECQGVSIFTSMCVLQHTKRTAAAPKIAAGVNYLFSLKIFSFLSAFPFPSFPAFCTISQHQQPTTFTSSKQKFLFEKSAAEVDFCSARFVAKAPVPPAQPAPPAPLTAAAAGSYCLLQIILTVLARDSRSNKGNSRQCGYAVVAVLFALLRDCLLYVVNAVCYVC